LASAARSVHERDAHAAYAEALVAMRRNDATMAERRAREAVGLGRGMEARLLLAGILIQTQDYAGARSALLGAAAVDPTSVAVIYDQALVAQKLGEYHAAREGYLRVLALDRTSMDARYNLVVLTHGAGADAEARHHVDEMAKISPGDSRIPLLRTLLAPQGPDAGGAQRQ
jgi:tetratricopeptide (TPR) repeat protein